MIAEKRSAQLFFACTSFVTKMWNRTRTKKNARLTPGCYVGKRGTKMSASTSKMFWSAREIPKMSPLHDVFSGSAIFFIFSLLLQRFCYSIVQFTLFQSTLYGYIVRLCCTFTLYAQAVRLCCTITVSAALEAARGRQRRDALRCR